jgi:biopolymer transport protein ExbD
LRKKSSQLDTDIEESIVNLTPLIDVIFVVLISFILIAPMLKTDQVALTETTQALPSLSKKSPLTIHLKKDGSVLLNNQKVNFAILEKQLRDKENKLIPPQILPDKDLPFYQYQKVKDLVQSSGFTEIDIVLQPS